MTAESEIATVPAPQLVTADPLASVRRFLAKSQPASSLRAFESDIRHYVAWCAEDPEGAVAMPASEVTVTRYLAALGDGTAKPSPEYRGHAVAWKYASIARRKASIGRLHRVHDLPDPTHGDRVLALLKSMRRSLGVQQRAVEPLLPDILRPVAKQMVLVNTERARRDVAILVLGLLTSLRRSEIAALNIEDLRFDTEGVWVRVGGIRTRDDGSAEIVRTKTDQDGEGAIVGMARGNGPLCPCTALRAWLQCLGRATGPLFTGLSRHGTSAGRKRINDGEISKIVKHAAEQAGLNPKDFAGHSLRRGFVTAAHRRGASTQAIMDQTRHTTEKMVRRYTKKDRTWKKHLTKNML